MAIKFTRSANIYDFVFLFLQNMILLLLLRMQKWIFDVTDGKYSTGLKYFMMQSHVEVDVSTVCHHILKPRIFQTLTGSVQTHSPPEVINDVYLKKINILRRVHLLLKAFFMAPFPLRWLFCVLTRITLSNSPTRNKSVRSHFSLLPP